MTQLAQITPNGFSYGQANGSSEPTQIAPFPNPKVPNYHENLPLQPYPIGGLLPSEIFPQNAQPPKLFETITIKGVEFVNRIWVSPMCMCT